MTTKEAKIHDGRHADALRSPFPALGGNSCFLAAGQPRGDFSGIRPRLAMRTGESVLGVNASLHGMICHSHNRRNL